MAFVDQPEPPAPGRIALGVVAATAVPFLWVPAGGHGPPAAFLTCPQIVLIFFPLVIWRLPKARSPLLTAMVTGALVEPILPVVVFAGVPLRGDAVRPIATLMAVGATAGLAYWLVVAAGNPYFSAGARRDRASG